MDVEQLNLGSSATNSKSSEDVEILQTEEEKFHSQHPMWKELMRAMNCKIDDFIIRLLQVTGFGTYHALKELSDEDLQFIVNFVRSGDILDRIEEEDLPMYLGLCKSKEKFSFLPGEKKLIFQIASYVKKNHSESEKSLGKMSLYPIFSKKKTSRKANCDLDNITKKSKGSDDLVSSLDLPKEVLDIKKILKEYCKKKSFPTEIANSVPSLHIEIKTVEKGTGAAYLSGVITCSICKNRQTVQRLEDETWNTSNMNRHWKSHVAKEDYKPVSKTLLGQMSLHASFSRVKPNSQPNSDVREEDVDDPEDIPIELMDTHDDMRQELDSQLVSGQSTIPETNAGGADQGF